MSSVYIFGQLTSTIMKTISTQYPWGIPRSLHALRVCARQTSRLRSSRFKRLLLGVTMASAVSVFTGGALAEPYDYFLNNNAPFLSAFGDDRETCSNIGFDYVSLPPVVAPGQQVKVKLQWNFLNPCNPAAMIFMNAFGNWQPGNELARLVDGESVGGTKTVTNAFSFQAPATPGTYRIRIPFVEAFAPVTNFYGGPLGGPSNPGIGDYAEVSLVVKRPPVEDYFANTNAAFLASFGNDRETCSNIGFDYIGLPPMVTPGQQVQVELQWNYLNPCNPSAMIFMNAFGDWQPGNELTRLVNGEAVGGTKTVTNAFSFSAPTTPGTYRIRIPFIEAFAPVTNFYGGPSGGPYAPGIGDYAEVTFTVKTPPALDHFLSNSAPFLCAFGDNRKTCSNIGFDYISLPPVVLPGQQVKVKLQWNFLNPCNPSAAIYMNAFGDWQPGTELKRLGNGEGVGGTRTVGTNFTFVAPVSTGTYRIRIPFVEAFAPVTNFYGGPMGGPSNPGIGIYAEASFSVASASQPEPSYYAGTGHYYEYVPVPGGITWSNALSAASASLYNGMPGHLATVTSDGENSFLMSMGIPGSGAWLGGIQSPPDTTVPDADWQWITGESWNYTHWWSGEPNDGAGNPEFELSIGGVTAPFGWWNDCPIWLTLEGYFVEYEPPTLSVAVSQVRICWNSTSNATYQIQYRSELTAGEWVNLGAPVVGNGGTTCVTDEVVSPRRLYRVLIVP
jgi:hypothetical protein